VNRLLSVFLVSAITVPAIEGIIDRETEKLGPMPDVSSVWTGPVVRAFSLGFADVLADLYWLRAVQYYGRERLTQNSPFADLAPLLETAAELDSRFEIVYRYGAVFLSEPAPIGAGQPQKGVAFLKRGADRNPQNWILRQEQGLLTFVYLDDAIGGSAVLRQASEIPGSSPWLKPLAAKVLADGGKIEASVQMWTIIRDQSEPGPLRENAEAQLSVVRNRLFARQLQQAIAEYRDRTGDKTSTLDELRARGVISTTRDMAGAPFDFDPATGIVGISKASPLWRRFNSAN
jgi:hypothetical protein